MSTIIVSLPEEDMKFLDRYARSQGVSAEDFLARQARSLREQLERPIHSKVIEATGIIAPEASELEHLEHLERKHR